jgi:hypothetical protein
MVGDERKGVNRRMGPFCQEAQPFQKPLAIVVISKNRPTLDTSCDDMLQCSFRIKTRFPGHWSLFLTSSIAPTKRTVKLVNYVIYTHGRRLFPEDKKRKSVFPTQRETSC